MSTKVCCSGIFFARKLTHRQKLTLCISLLPPVALGLFLAIPFMLGSAPVGLWSGGSAQGEDRTGQAPRSEADPGQTAAASSSSAAGSIPVRVARLDSIQPDSMVQTFSGIILPKRTSRLAAKQLARVMQVQVNMGDPVEADQVLVELDARELLAERDMLRAQLLSAEARLEELQRGPRRQEIEQAESMVRELEAMHALRQATVRRTERLVKSSSVSEQEWDESFASLEATHAQLMSARKTLELLQEGTRQEQIDAQAATVSSLRSQLDKVDVLISDHRIVAPFSGHVQTRFVDEGVIVTPGEPIVEIVESGSLEVHVGLPYGVVDASTLRSAQILCGAHPVSAEPSRIAPTIDQRTRNMEVVFALSSSSAGCRIGGAVDVAVELPVDRAGWWVPSSALVPAARGLWSVLIAQPVENSQAAANSRESKTRRVGLRQVELLRSSGEWSQVQGSLSPEDWVILNGSHRVTKGQLVNCQLESNVELDLPVENLSAGGSDP